ncbi:ATP-binding protein [Streptomyces sp. NPDC101132]|uniref:ATP-binding protein n=1 Tax=Streptomyces sp. NPDC101132 TaxID=3366110 RepID=UPI0037F4FAF7
MRTPIPSQDTSFVGRDAEVARLRPWLRRPGLITVTGSGGVGKTRLAARLAALLSSEPGGEGVDVEAAVGGRAGVDVCWTPLWTLRGGGLLGAAVAEAAGLADHSPRVPVAALTEWIGRRRVLLVLDSCEHLVAECAALAGELLAACPALTVLATSREPLGVPGERVHELGPLPAATDGLTLFLDRAAAAGAALTRPVDLATAAGLCRRLEGMPLALELAAAQLRERPPAALAALLGEGLHEVLDEGPDEGRADDLGAAAAARPRRLRALRTSIGWSHELCTPAERLLWARMSVFRTETGLAVLRAVCCGGPLDAPALDAALAGLCRKSVVTLTPEGRYRMLDTVREYGDMWLAELGERDRVADRHGRYFLSLAREADRAWFGPAQPGAYRDLGEAYPDVCAALDHLGLTDPAAALELAALVGFFWACGGHLHEAGHYLARVTATGGAGPDGAVRPGPAPDGEAPHRDVPLHAYAAPDAHARALWALGLVRALQGDLPAAAELALTSRAHAELLRDDDRLLDAAYLQGVVLLLRGRAADAGACAARALAELRGTPARRVRCLLVGVFALTGEGRLAEALAAATDLRDECVRRGEVWTRSYLDHQLALGALLSGSPAEAEVCARRMVAGKDAIGDAFGVALGLDLLSASLAAQDRATESADVYGAAFACWRTVGHPQRGTPELSAVRDGAERRARAAIGDGAYDRAFVAGAYEDPGAALRRILAEPV